MARSRVSRADMLDRPSVLADGPHTTSDAYAVSLGLTHDRWSAWSALLMTNVTPQEGACREITGRAPG